MTKTGLILEGGAMRGMYTAGVLDVFMENCIEFDGAIFRNQLAVDDHQKKIACEMNPVMLSFKHQMTKASGTESF